MSRQLFSLCLFCGDEKMEPPMSKIIWHVTASMDAGDGVEIPFAHPTQELLSRSALAEGVGATLTLLETGIPAAAACFNGSASPASA